MVELVSSLRRSGEDIDHNLRWGVYVAVRAADDYVEQRFADYGVATDDTGRYAVLYRPLHFIGLELGLSIAARTEPTGTPEGSVGDVITVAKKDLRPGDVLDGEGGYTVRGEALPAGSSLHHAALPIGLANGSRSANTLA